MLPISFPALKEFGSALIGGIPSMETRRVVDPVYSQTHNPSDIHARRDKEC